MKTVVALLDFGGPRGPEQLKPFLSELLTDVLPGPLWLRRLAGPFIAGRRAPIVQHDLYRIGPGNHVVVGEDVPLLRHDDTGTQGALDALATGRQLHQAPKRRVIQ